MALLKKKAKKIPATQPAEKQAMPEKKGIREVHLLEKGYQPEKNKIGSEFKGKNRVIIA